MRAFDHPGVVGEIDEGDYRYRPTTNCASTIFFSTILLFSTDDNHQVSFSVNYSIFYRYRATSICASTIFFSTITCYSPFFYGYQPPPNMLQLFYFLLISTNQIPTLTWHGISQLELFKVRSHKKKNDIIWEFFPTWGGGSSQIPKLL